MKCNVKRHRFRNEAMNRFKDMLKIECQPANPIGISANINTNLLIGTTDNGTLPAPVTKNFVIGAGTKTIANHLQQLQQLYQPKEIHIADNDQYLPQSETLLFTTTKVCSFASFFFG